MPFEQRIPHPLTKNGVLHYAPTSPGIYGLSNARQWVFIGETGDIQTSLLQHVQSLDTDILQWEPTGFVFEVCTGPKVKNRHDALVLEYMPTCNHRSNRRQQTALGKRQDAR